MEFDPIAFALSPDHTLEELTVTENGEYTPPDGVDGFSKVVAEIPDYMHQRLMDTLTHIDTGDATTISKWAFAGTSSLKTGTFPNVTYIRYNAFLESTIERGVFPLVTSLESSCFNSCNNFKFADFPVLSNIGTQNFRYSVMTTLVLRYAGGVCTLTNVNAFENTPVENGTGYIYVPRSLMDSYKAATNWSTYAAQFRALEDYTVDGTTTGAFDETKI